VPKVLWKKAEFITLEPVLFEQLKCKYMAKFHQSEKLHKTTSQPTNKQKYTNLSSQTKPKMKKNICIN